MLKHHSITLTDGTTCYFITVQDKKTTLDKLIVVNFLHQDNREYMLYDLKHWRRTYGPVISWFILPLWCYLWCEKYMILKLNVSWTDWRLCHFKGFKHILSSRWYYELQLFWDNRYMRLSNRPIPRPLNEDNNLLIIQINLKFFMNI